MTVYIDSDYKCHVLAAEGRRAVETDAFNGKCEEWIESYRFVPDGETWTREDGEEFRGEMTAPWKDLGNAYAAQNAQYEAALSEIEVALGVNA